jgi:hypothetical protein
MMESFVVVVVVVVVVVTGEAHHKNCLTRSQAPAMRACARLNKDIAGAMHRPTQAS